MLRKDETILSCMKNGKGFMCSKGSLQSEAFGKLSGCGTAGTGTALKLNYAESCKRANVFLRAGRCAILIAMFGMLFLHAALKLKPSVDYAPMANPDRCSAVKEYMMYYPDKDIYRDGKQDCKDYAYLYKILYDVLFGSGCEIWYAAVQYPNQPVSYHLIVKLDGGGFIEPAFYCNSNPEEYYKILWVEKNKWCDVNRQVDYRTIQKVRDWVYAQ